MFIRYPWLLGHILLGKLTYRKKSKEKVIYLTFDDGPTPEVTPLVLDLLDEYGWKATFFCVGENVEKYPDLYQEILKRGHKTGNHTYKHLKGLSTSTHEYIENVQKSSNFIDSNLFRPPYGKIRRRQKKELQKQYEIIMWDLLTGDYKKKTSLDRIIQTIKRFTRKGSIVVFHDSLKARNNMLATLPKAIEFWNEKGYQSKLL